MTLKEDIIKSSILLEAFDADTVINQLKNSDNDKVKKLDDNFYNNNKIAITTFLTKLRNYNPAIMKQSIGLMVKRFEHTNQSPEIYFIENFNNPDSYISYFRYKPQLNKLTDETKKREAEKLFKDFSNETNGGGSLKYFEDHIIELFSSKKSLKKVNDDSDVEWFYKKNGWEVLSPKTFAAASKYSTTEEGKTAWCTAASKNYFDQYTNNGKNKLIILKNYNENKAYQFCDELESNGSHTISFMNKDDISMGTHDVNDLIKGVPMEVLEKLTNLTTDDKVLITALSKHKNFNKKPKENNIDGKEKIEGSFNFYNEQSLRNGLRKYFPKNTESIARQIVNIDYNRHKSSPANTMTMFKGTIYIDKGLNYKSENIIYYVTAITKDSNNKPFKTVFKVILNKESKKLVSITDNGASEYITKSTSFFKNLKPTKRIPPKDTETAIKNDYGVSQLLLNNDYSKQKIRINYYGDNKSIKRVDAILKNPREQPNTVDFNLDEKEIKVAGGFPHIYYVNGIKKADPSSSISLKEFKKNYYKLYLSLLRNFPQLKKELVERNLASVDTLKEEISHIKFAYKGKYSHDKFPEVLVLDSHYDGKKYRGEKNETDDILAFNLNYSKNKKNASNNIEDIMDFASLLDANKLEKYKRLNYFYNDEINKMIRRYKKKGIKGLKKRGKDGIWVNASVDSIDSNNEIK